MGGNAEFSDQIEVKEKVESLWAKVFQSSNNVLHQHKIFGFTGIELIPQPNIHERLVLLQVLSAIIDVLLNSAGGVLEYEQQRQLLNAKSQITTMEQLATALKGNNQSDYEAAVAALELQTVI